MKRIFLSLALLVAVAFVTFAEKHINESEVPVVVKNRFHALFKEAKNVKWQNEFGNYEAEFEMNKVETSCLFAPNGQWLQTETAISTNEFPATATAYLAKNVGDKKIKETTKILDAKGITTYEAEVGGEDYIFDANGNFLRKQKA